MLRELGVTTALGRPAHPIRTADLNLPWWCEKVFRNEEAVSRSGAALHIFNGHIVDPLVRFARWNRGLTVGMTSALWLAKLLPHRPADDHWMIGEAKFRPLFAAPNVRLYRSRNAFKDAVLVTMHGIKVRRHQPLRAVLDCVRFRAQLGLETVRDALRAVLSSGELDRDAILGAAWRNRLGATTQALLSNLELGAAPAPSTPMIQLRPVEKADVENVVRLVCDVGLDASADLFQLPESYRTKYPTMPDAFFVALDGTRLIGTAGIRRIDYGVFELRHFCVAKDARGQGVGTQLLKACLWGWRRSANSCVVATKPELPSGIAFFERHGFVSDGANRHRRDRREEAEWRRAPSGIFVPR